MSRLLTLVLSALPGLALAGDFPTYRGVLQEKLWGVHDGEATLVGSAFASTARDSEGRLYRRTGKTISIFDPVARKKITLHTESRVAEVRDISPEVLERYMRTESQPDPYDSKVQDLGKRTILGQLAEGKLVSWEQDAAGTRCTDGQGEEDLCLEVKAEEWIATDLGLHLESHAEVYIPLMGATSKRDVVYVELDLSEPDPALFEIPAGYDVREIGSGPEDQP